MVGQDHLLKMVRGTAVEGKLEFGWAVQPLRLTILDVSFSSLVMAGEDLLIKELLHLDVCVSIH
jgi:hypothetical protein